MINPPLLTPFTARDGENLAHYEWHTDAWDPETGYAALPPRAVVLMVHGLGEHAGRYGHVADQLLDWGFAVRAYDQRGHGQSSGERGCLPRDVTLLEDLADVIEATRLHCQASSLPADAALPLILLGHSLGGLVASRFVALQMMPVEGLVLSSPAFDAGLSGPQKLLLSVMPRLAPKLCVGNGLDARWLSHDEGVVRDYLSDPWVHDRISPRLARFIESAGPATLAAAAHWRTPTLLMYAGADRLVSPAGSRAFANAVANSPHVRAGTVTSKCFEGLYHELFNETGASQVFETLKVWLDARF